MDYSTSVIQTINKILSQLEQEMENLSVFLYGLFLFGNQLCNTYFTLCSNLKLQCFAVIWCEFLFNCNLKIF